MNRTTRTRRIADYFVFLFLSFLVTSAGGKARAHWRCGLTTEKLNNLLHLPPRRFQDRRNCTVQRLHTIAYRGKSEPTSSYNGISGQEPVIEYGAAGQHHSSCTGIDTLVNHLLLHSCLVDMECSCRPLQIKIESESASTDRLIGRLIATMIASGCTLVCCKHCAYDDSNRACKLRTETETCACRMAHT